MKKKNRGGTLLMVLGVLLLLGAGILTAYNIILQNRAGNEATRIVESLAAAVAEKAETADTAEAESPEQIINLPDATRPMPTFEIDGNLYIGILQIPKLGLELPIMSEWSYPSLFIAPCRFTGSLYADNLVIAAHNYSTHFGRFADELSVGDDVIFYDADGVAYVYTVSLFETLGPTEVEYMSEGEYPLTLFTCTWGGASRVTVRCDKKPDNWT